jgi:hypothetical protein
MEFGFVHLAAADAEALKFGGAFEVVAEDPTEASCRNWFIDLVTAPDPGMPIRETTHNVIEVNLLLLNSPLFQLGRMKEAILQRPRSSTRRCRQLFCSSGMSQPNGTQSTSGVSRRQAS